MLVRATYVERVCFSSRVTEVLNAFSHRSLSNLFFLLVVPHLRTLRLVYHVASTKVSPASYMNSVYLAVLVQYCTRTKTPP